MAGSGGGAVRQCPPGSLARMTGCRGDWVVDLVFAEQFDGDYEAGEGVGPPPAEGQVQEEAECGGQAEGGAEQCFGCVCPQQAGGEAADLGEGLRMGSDAPLPQAQGWHDG